MSDTPHDTTPEEEVLEGEIVDEDKWERQPDWPPWAPAALAAMRDRPNLSAAARVAGVHRRTLYYLIERSESFAVALHDAREQALDALEDIILLRATRGQPVKRKVTKRQRNEKGDLEVIEETEYEEAHLSDIHAIFYLKRWRPEYRDTHRVEHGGVPGRPVRVEVYRMPDRERALDLARIALELESGDA